MLPRRRRRSTASIFDPARGPNLAWLYRGLARRIAALLVASHLRTVRFNRELRAEIGKREQIERALRQATSASGQIAEVRALKARLEEQAMRDRSPASTTGATSTTCSSASWCARAPARLPALRGDGRPRPLQGAERHLRPPRPATRCLRRAGDHAERAACAPATSSAAGAARSSSWCCRTCRSRMPAAGGDAGSRRSATCACHSESRAESDPVRRHRGLPGQRPRPRRAGQSRRRRALRGEARRPRLRPDGGETGRWRRPPRLRDPKFGRRPAATRQAATVPARMTASGDGARDDGVSSPDRSSTVTPTAGGAVIDRRRSRAVVDHGGGGGA